MNHRTVPLVIMDLVHQRELPWEQALLLELELVLVVNFLRRNALDIEGKED